MKMIEGSGRGMAVPKPSQMRRNYLYIYVVVVVGMVYVYMYVHDGFSYKCAVDYLSYMCVLCVCVERTHGDRLVFPCERLTFALYLLYHRWILFMLHISYVILLLYMLIEREREKRWYLDGTPSYQSSRLMHDDVLMQCTSSLVFHYFLVRLVAMFCWQCNCISLSYFVQRDEYSVCMRGATQCVSHTVSIDRCLPYACQRIHVYTYCQVEILRKKYKNVINAFNEYATRIVANIVDIHKQLISYSCQAQITAKHCWCFTKWEEIAIAFYRIFLCATSMHRHHHLYGYCEYVRYKPIIMIDSLSSDRMFDKTRVHAARVCIRFWFVPYQFCVSVSKQCRCVHNQFNTQESNIFAT